MDDDEGRDEGFRRASAAVARPRFGFARRVPAPAGSAPGADGGRNIFPCDARKYSRVERPGRAPGRVYLIGAGPGDPELLTVRGARALAESDVVVYDELVGPGVLAYARHGALLVAGGKRAGAPSVPQEQINRMLVDFARAGRTVARLKGGDPFVFGRGGEEAEALVAACVPWEVVPGVSAGLAAAAYAGIPLTHRDHASSVAFVTGHGAAPKSGRALAPSIAAGAPRADAGSVAAGEAGADTVVVFMCARSIDRVARDMVAAGRAPETPAAVVCSGTLAEQRVFVGTLADLAARPAGAPPFPAPAVAVVGEVVRLRASLRWFDGGAPERSIAGYGAPGALHDSLSQEDSHDDELVRAAAL